MRSETSIQESIQILHEEFRHHFIERDEEILGAFLAILSNENILFLGPPGTAKTYLAQNICKSIDGAGFFYYLLTRFTTPEEIFGPLSIRSLEKDEFRRKTDGCLPASHIAFLDEIFKANSSILNSLLTILNERRFHNGTSVVDTPLLTVFGASNELPEEDENLEALYDRFLFRYDVRYIQNEENVKTLLFENPGEIEPSVRLTVDQIREMRERAGDIPLSEDVRAIILSLKKHLEERDSEEENGFWISDRRWKKIMGVLKVAAAVNGYTAVTRTMLLLLQHMLWDLPGQREHLRAVIIDHVVSGGINTRKLETGIHNLQAMLLDEQEITGDADLPVPVYAHDNEGNNQKITTYRTLTEASRSGRYYYFTIDHSFSTCYQFPQVMELLRQTYGMEPETQLKADKRSVCAMEYASLEQQYRDHASSLRYTIDHLKSDLDSNIWLTALDRDEVSCVLRERMSRLHDLEDKMAALTDAFQKAYPAAA